MTYNIEQLKVFFGSSIEQELISNGRTTDQLEKTQNNESYIIRFEFITENKNNDLEINPLKHFKFSLWKKVK